MRTSRVVACLALAPLALGLGWLVADERATAWLEQEPVLVATGQAFEPAAFGDIQVTVLGAGVAEPGSDAVGSADAPEGSQVVVVDVRMEGADDPETWCSFQLEATVDGHRARWAQDAGASELTGCYSETGSLSGTIGFVVPDGTIDDARLLVGGASVWLGVGISG